MRSIALLLFLAACATASTIPVTGTIWTMCESPFLDVHCHVPDWRSSVSISLAGDGFNLRMFQSDWSHAYTLVNQIVDGACCTLDLTLRTGAGIGVEGTVGADRFGVSTAGTAAEAHLILTVNDGLMTGAVTLTGGGKTVSVDLEGLASVSGGVVWDSTGSPSGGGQIEGQALISVRPTPEPSPAALVVLALLAMAIRAGRKRRADR